MFLGEEAVTFNCTSISSIFFKNENELKALTSTAEQNSSPVEQFPSVLSLITALFCQLSPEIIDRMKSFHWIFTNTRLVKGVSVNSPWAWK